MKYQRQKHFTAANMVHFSKGNTISHGENKFLLLVWLWPTRFKVVTLASLFQEHVILSSIQQIWNSSQINSPQIGLTHIPLRGWERGLYTANHSRWTYMFCRIPPLLLHLKLARGLPQRKRWHPTPVLLPGKSHGWRSLVCWSPWGRWVGHDWATSLSLSTFMHGRRKWQPTPVFLPGESQGQRSLVGCCLWGRTELDMTEVT